MYNNQNNSQLSAASQEQYGAPQIEIMEIETSQNILGGSGDPGDDYTPEPF